MRAASGRSKFSIGSESLSTETRVSVSSLSALQHHQKSLVTQVVGFSRLAGNFDEGTLDQFLPNHIVAAIDKTKAWEWASVDGCCWFWLLDSTHAVWGTV